MPTSIPYDSSLVLGQVVDISKIESLQRISQEEHKIDKAEAYLNRLLQTKLSLEATLYQLHKHVKAETRTKLENTIKKLDDDIATAFEGVVDAKVAAATDDADATPDNNAIAPNISYSAESPIDWDKSPIKTLPLANQHHDIFDVVSTFPNDRNKQKRGTLHCWNSGILSEPPPRELLGFHPVQNLTTAISNQAAWQQSNRT